MYLSGTKMNLINLPIPVFQAIMEELIFTVGLYKAFEYRLVSSMSVVMFASLIDTNISRIV